MTTKHIEFGSLVDEQKPDCLAIKASRLLFSAINDHPDFHFVEFRKTDDSEILVVDCTNDSVPTKNKIGIKYCECLALCIFEDLEKTPEIRALRSDFPVTFHQNLVLPGEPLSLCVYFEPWSAIKRSWTAQKFLTRIQWWLVNIAMDTLHPADQPLEPLYFDARYKLVIPLDFDEKVNNPEFVFIPIPRLLAENDFKIMEGRFFRKTEAVEKLKSIRLTSITVSIPPIIHGPVEITPATFGQLKSQLLSRGVDFQELLFSKIRDKAKDSALVNNGDEYFLVLLTIPLKRTDGNDIEKVQQKGFIVHKNIGQFGEKAGILQEHQGRFWSIELVGGNADTAWEEVTIEPVDIISPLTRDFARRTSGITSEGPSGILAGLGALGSSLANIWYREGWGKWTLIDHDVLEPHNLARHTTFENQVGSYKVNAVKELENSIYPFELNNGSILPEKANKFEDEHIRNALGAAELIIDATTTLDVPRDLSTQSDICRTASVFITPSGSDAVLLIEDSDRNVRLDKLESQYYRAIISDEWGKSHLEGHQGQLTVGGGCRDISAIIPSDLLFQNASVLARQIRLKSAQDEAGIYVWHCDKDSGSIEAYSIAPRKAIHCETNDMNVIWDEGIRNKLRKLRSDNLPNETGGILLGYYDFILSNIYIVDALPAPSDSQGDRTGFSRGIIGLEETVKNAQERTADIVGYIGEWHSHPPGVAANPSSADVYLLANLASELHRDGLPALMLIVGENDEQIIIGKSKELI